MQPSLKRRVGNNWIENESKKLQSKTERSDFVGYSYAPPKMAKATAIAFNTLLVWEAEAAAGGVFSKRFFMQITRVPQLRG